MLVQEWIKGAQGKGWRVQSVIAAKLNMRCCKQGCPGSMAIPLANPGPIPAQCDLPHVGEYSAPTFEEYKTLIAELRRRRVQLGLDQTDLGNAMGLADGHVNKLESFQKTASPPTLLLWVQSLGLKLTTTPATLPAATIRAIDQRQARPYSPARARFKHDH